MRMTHQGGPNGALWRNRKGGECQGLRSASPLPASVWEVGCPSPSFPPSLFELWPDKAGLGENLAPLRFKKNKNFFPSIQLPRRTPWFWGPGRSRSAPSSPS
jgi:hypothetical protein